VTPTPRLPPNGPELGRSAEAGGATHTVAPAGGQDKRHADSAEQPGDISTAQTCGQQATTSPHGRRVACSELVGGGKLQPQQDYRARKRSR